MRKLISLGILIFSSLIFSACNPLLNKSKSGLQVITNDIKASLFLNDEYLDKTPYINKQIKPGIYTLKIQPDDEKYVPYETSITLNQGLLTVVTWKSGETAETSGGVFYEMEKLMDKNQTEISFKTIPDNTIIKFDNQDQEFTPLVISDMTEGDHEFEITLPSYVTQHHSINAVKGHRINVTVVLAKSSQTIDSNEPTVVSDSAEVVKNSLDEAEEKQEIEVVKIKSTNYFNNGIEVLRVRQTPESTGAELGFVESGKEYPLLDKQNNWYKIKFDSKQGYIKSTYAEIIN
jgi:uncharacterized protein YgiM (DUF1202 family)